MEVYITAMACISAHPTFKEEYFFEEKKLPQSSTLHAETPDYKTIIPAASLRRSSHIQKMGLFTAMTCLQKANVTCPDAIVVGTGTGCFEDTDKFLRSMVENDETMVSPTPFIQSTHNTVAGQIALLTKCQGYNFTYVHQNLSFDSALQDAMMLLGEGEAKNVLVGGLDELNDSLTEFLNLAGHLKNSDVPDNEIWSSETKGYVAGEGAAFFVLEKNKSDNSLACLNATKTIQKIIDTDDLMDQISDFLIFNQLPAPDLILSGLNGDAGTDVPLRKIQEIMKTPAAYFKVLCGEYFTASAFALWLGVKILEKKSVPAVIQSSKQNFTKLNHILIINHYQNQQYSLQYISTC